MERKCIECGEDISLLTKRSTRCGECQKAYSAGAYSRRKNGYYNTKKKDDRLNIYLHKSKPKLIAFLEAYEAKNYEDIDLPFCTDFISFVAPYYKVYAHQSLSLVDEMNHLIIKIIDDFTPPA